MARATSLDQSVIAYLESLSTRAYYAIYGSQIGLGKRIVNFFRRDWPQAMQTLWKDTIASFSTLALGAFVAFFLMQKIQIGIIHLSVKDLREAGTLVRQLKAYDQPYMMEATQTG